MSYELPLPPWVPDEMVVQTFLQKNIVVRTTTQLPPNAVLNPGYVRQVVFVVPTSSWIPVQE